MATHTKFLVEFTSITFATILALLDPSLGFPLGMILVMATRFALLGRSGRCLIDSMAHLRGGDRTLLVCHSGSVQVGHHTFQTNHQPNLSGQRL